MDGIALFSLGQPSPGVCGLYGRVNCELQEGLHQGGSAGLPPGLLLPGPPSLWWTPASHTSTRDPPTGSFDSVSCGGSAPFLWVLVCTRFCLCPPRLESLFPPGLWRSCNPILLAFRVRFPGDPQSLCWIPSTPTWQVWDLILSWLHPSCHHAAASSLSWDMGSLSLVGCTVLLSTAVEQLVGILVFLQEMSTHPSSLPSWTRRPRFKRSLRAGSWFVLI